MSQRFEAFTAEYEALCKKYGVGIFAWKESSLKVFDILECDDSCMDLQDRTSEADGGKETE